MPKRCLRDFLRTLHEEFDADIYCFQECGSWGQNCFIDEEGFRLFISEAQKGCRCVGIAVRERLLPYVVPESWQTDPRAASLLLKFPTVTFQVLTAHLHPGHDIDTYEDTIEDVVNLLGLRPKGAQILLAVDAQTDLGRPTQPEDSRVLGEFSSA